jgi:rhamnogalacturonyl hydrolase YesR
VFQKKRVKLDVKKKMKYKFYCLFLLIINGLGTLSAQTKSYSEDIAETIMRQYPDSIVIRKFAAHMTQDNQGTDPDKRPASWEYDQAVILKGIEQLWRQTGDKRYFDYIKKMIDLFVQEDGTIRTYDLNQFSTDFITPGRLVLTLFQETKQEKYRKAADLLRLQLTWQPRTKEGGFWHKHKYPYQMWLDGLYMADLFYAEYCQIFRTPPYFDDVANQFIWVEQHTRNAETGLLHHGWDESKLQKWADPKTGQSPEIWSRAMGWFAVALVDVLDYLPKNHAKRPQIVAILTRLATAIDRYQDVETGVWYQITDKATWKGNYLEASGSCMFTYALAKGVRMGYLDEKYQKTAEKAYAGILKNFIETDAKGTIHLTKTCSGAGLGGVPYRDGSFKYYVNEPLRTDDLKAIGPFIQAGIELKLLGVSANQLGK